MAITRTYPGFALADPPVDQEALAVAGYAVEGGRCADSVNTEQILLVAPHLAVCLATRTAIIFPSGDR